MPLDTPPPVSPPAIVVPYKVPQSKKTRCIEERPLADDAGEPSKVICPPGAKRRRSQS